MPKLELKTPLHPAYNTELNRNHEIKNGKQRTNPSFRK